MDYNEKLIDTEISLRKYQSDLGFRIIVITGIGCMAVIFITLASGGMFSEKAPAGATAKLLLSEQFARLVMVLATIMAVALAAGIILMKSSVKHIAKSYFENAKMEPEEVKG